MDDLAIIYRPKAFPTYDRQSDPVDAFLNAILRQHPSDSRGQLGLYPFFYSKTTDYGALRSAGIAISRRIAERRNLLKKFFGEEEVNAALREFQRKYGGQFVEKLFRSRITDQYPTYEQHRRLMDFGMLQDFEELGIKRPGQVRRFVIVLDPRDTTIDTIILPYLKELELEFQIKSVK
ncbi:hypothetical protein HYX07_01685 [Candidatus Woesearchaeota archaeon]|nr:hypothetical protein [Candidatus Woesearchaeota archaeon]